jgi:hypothetical protein
MRIHLYDRVSPFRDVLAGHLEALGYRVEMGECLASLERLSGRGETDLVVAAQGALPASRFVPTASRLVARGRTPDDVRVPLILIVESDTAAPPPVDRSFRLLGTLTRPFPLAVLEWLLRAWRSRPVPEGVSELAPSSEQRRSLRVPCCRAATLAWHSNGQATTQACVLRDVSLHGAGIRTVGSSGGAYGRLEVLIPMPERPPLRIVGRTVRSQALGPGQVLGVEWAPMSPAQRTGLATLFQGL